MPQSVEERKDRFPELTVHRVIKGPSAKRRRVEIACTNCRNRKSRCDGNRPACSSCTHLRLLCQYQQISEQNRSGQSARRERLDQKTNERQSRSQSSLGTSAFNNKQEYIHTGEPDENESSNEADVDTLATKTFYDESETDIGHFGPSSNHALFRSIADSFVRLICASRVNRENVKPSNTRHLQSKDQTDSEGRSGKSSHVLHIYKLNLPAEAKALQLIKQFFLSIGSVLPIVSESNLIAIYHQLKQNSSSAIYHSKEILLNIVLAHATMVQGDLDKDSKMYYHRALEALDRKTLQSTSHELVPALLLIAVYQQNMQLAMSSWTYHALAVKTAFQLGLHSPRFYQDYPPKERELWKRLWYGLINQDRILSMVLGRPLLIPPQHVRTPKLVTFLNDLGPGEVTSQNQLLSSEFHERLTSLCAIIAVIIHDLYDDNIDLQSETTLSDILTSRLPILFELQKWESEADPTMKIISEAELETQRIPLSEGYRLRLVISVHYYRAVLLLNHPVLTKGLTDITQGNSSNWNTGHLLENSAAAIKHQFNTVRTLYQLLCTVIKQGDSVIDQSNAWWLCNYTLTTVVINLFGMLLLCHMSEPQPLMDGISDIEVRQLFVEAIKQMETIQRTSLMNRSVRHCLSRFLEIFDSTFLNQQQQGKSSSTISQPADQVSSFLAYLDFDFDDLFSQYMIEEIPSIFEQDAHE